MGTRSAERAGSEATGWLYKLNLYAETDLRDIGRTPSFQYASDLAGLYQNEKNFLRKTGVLSLLQGMRWAGTDSIHLTSRME